MPSTSTPQPERHLGPSELAERENVPLATVYKWRTTGTGPKGFTVGRHVRYRLSEVLAWEEEQLKKNG